MRRIMLLLTVALVMAVVMMASALPAFAAGKCTFPRGEFIQCTGGEGSQGGGVGGRTATDFFVTFIESNGGGGGQGGGEGSRCAQGGGGTFAGGRCVGSAY